MRTTDNKRRYYSEPKRESRKDKALGDNSEK